MATVLYWQVTAPTRRYVTDDELDLLAASMPCSALIAAEPDRVHGYFPATDGDAAMAIFRDVLHGVLGQSAFTDVQITG